MYDVELGGRIKRLATFHHNNSICSAWQAPNSKGLTASQSPEQIINWEQSRGLFSFYYGYHWFPDWGEAALKMHQRSFMNWTTINQYGAGQTSSWWITWLASMPKNSLESTRSAQIPWDPLYAVFRFQTNHYPQLLVDCVLISRIRRCGCTFSPPQNVSISTVKGMNSHYQH